MKWGNVCILNLDSGDSEITRSATMWKERYHVPDNRCFVPEAPQVGFVHAGNGCLNPSVCSLRTKLMIFAHGEVDDVHDIPPKRLGDYLYNQMGLRTVGLIAFKVCWTGKGDYLDRLAAQLSTRGARIGWLLGYTERVSTEEIDIAGMPRETTTEKDWQLRLSGSKLPDDERVKVVKGNAWHECRIEGSRRYAL